MRWSAVAKALRNLLLIGAGLVTAFALIIFLAIYYLDANSKRNKILYLAALPVSEVIFGLKKLGFKNVGTFSLDAGAADFCSLQSPVFPRRLKPLPWMINGGVQVTCWDGETDRKPISFFRVCHPSSGNAAEVAVAEIWTDISGGSWDGGILPEDSGGPCLITGST